MKVKIIIFFTAAVFISGLAGYALRLDRPDRFGSAMIDWVDCVQINDTKYYSNPLKTSISSDLINKKVGKVKFNVGKMVHNADYHFRNGDATFLEVGTELYSLNSNEDAIAAKVGEEYFIYKIIAK